MDFFSSSPKCRLSLLSITNQLRLKNLDLANKNLISLCWKTRQVSSAYNRRSLSTACDMSLIYIKKNSKPKVKPCDTSHVIDAL